MLKPDVVSRTVYIVIMQTQLSLPLIIYIFCLHLSFLAAHSKQMKMRLIERQFKTGRCFATNHSLKEGTKVGV